MSKVKDKTKDEEYREDIERIIQIIAKSIDDSLLYNVRLFKRMKNGLIDKLSDIISIQKAKKVISESFKKLPKAIYHGEIYGCQLKKYYTTVFRDHLYSIFQDFDNLLIIDEDIDEVYKKSEKVVIVKEVGAASEKKDLQKVVSNQNSTSGTKDVNTKAIVPLKTQLQPQFGRPTNIILSTISLEKSQIEVARISPGSTNRVARCIITDEYSKYPELNNMWVFFKPFTEYEVIGILHSILTDNSTQGRLLKATLMRNDTDQNMIDLLENIDVRVAKISILKVRKNDWIKPELGNSPPTGIPVYQATDSQMKAFFSKSVSHPINFVRIKGRHPFIPDFELMELMSQHIYILGKTHAGKGHLANAFMVSLVGREFKIPCGEKRRVACLYFDYTGQFCSDAYGYFKALKDYCGEDPRVIYNADKIGIQTSQDLIDTFCRKYRILDLGWDSRHISAIQRHLEAKISIDSTYSDFRTEFPLAINSAYAAGTARTHIQKFDDYMDNLGDEIWRNEIEPIISPTLYDEIINHLKDGKFVIIDLSKLGSNEYKPGTVYRILKYIHDQHSSNFAKSQKEMDFPVAIGLDECQNFAPKTTRLHSGYYLEECNKLISDICAEDRKTGISMILITQRLAWTNRNVLANIGSWFVSKINGVDLEAVKKELGSYDFVNFKKWYFHIFGDGSLIQNFNSMALEPKTLAKIKGGLFKS